MKAQSTHRNLKRSLIDVSNYSHKQDLTLDHSSRLNKPSLLDIAPVAEELVQENLPQIEPASLASPQSCHFSQTQDLFRQVSYRANPVGSYYHHNKARKGAYVKSQMRISRVRGASMQGLVSGEGSTNYIHMQNQLEPHSLDDTTSLSVKKPDYIPQTTKADSIRYKKKQFFSNIGNWRHRENLAAFDRSKDELSPIKHQDGNTIGSRSRIHIMKMADSSRAATNRMTRTNHASKISQPEKPIQMGDLQNSSLVNTTMDHEKFGTKTTEFGPFEQRYPTEEDFQFNAQEISTQHPDAAVLASSQMQQTTIPKTIISSGSNESMPPKMGTGPISPISAVSPSSTFHRNLRSPRSPLRPKVPSRLFSQEGQEMVKENMRQLNRFIKSIDQQLINQSSYSNQVGPAFGPGHLQTQEDMVNSPLSTAPHDLQFKNAKFSHQNQMKKVHQIYSKQRLNLVSPNALSDAGRLYKKVNRKAKQSLPQQLKLAAPSSISKPNFDGERTGIEESNAQTTADQRMSPENFEHFSDFQDAVKQRSFVMKLDKSASRYGPSNQATAKSAILRGRSKQHKISQQVFAGKRKTHKMGAQDFRMTGDAFMFQRVLSEFSQHGELSLTGHTEAMKSKGQPAENTMSTPFLAQASRLDNSQVQGVILAENTCDSTETKERVKSLKDQFYKNFNDSTRRPSQQTKKLLKYYASKENIAEAAPLSPAEIPQAPQTQLNTHRNLTHSSKRRGTEGDSASPKRSLALGGKSVEDIRNQKRNTQTLKNIFSSDPLEAAQTSGIGFIPEEENETTRDHNTFKNTAAKPSRGKTPEVREISPSSSKGLTPNSHSHAPVSIHIQNAFEEENSTTQPKLPSSRKAPKRVLSEENQFLSLKMPLHPPKPRKRKGRNHSRQASKLSNHTTATQLKLIELIRPKKPKQRTPSRESTHQSPRNKSEGSRHIFQFGPKRQMSQSVHQDWREETMAQNGFYIDDTIEVPPLPMDVRNRNPYSRSYQTLLRNRQELIKEKYRMHVIPPVNESSSEDDRYIPDPRKRSRSKHSARHYTPPHSAHKSKASQSLRQPISGMSPSSIQNSKQERQELEDKVKQYDENSIQQKKLLLKLQTQIESMNFHSKNAITFFRFFKNYHVEKEKEMKKKISSPPSSAAGYNRFRRMITRKTMIARQISFNKPVRTKTKSSIRFSEPL